MEEGANQTRVYKRLAQMLQFQDAPWIDTSGTSSCISSRSRWRVKNCPQACPGLSFSSTSFPRAIFRLISHRASFFFSRHESTKVQTWFVGSKYVALVCWWECTSCRIWGIRVQNTVINSHMNVRYIARVRCSQLFGAIFGFEHFLEGITHSLS